MMPAALLISALFLLNSTHAWSAHGHRIVADISYKSMKPETRLNADQLLQISANEFRNHSNFVLASTWADDYRSQREMGANTSSQHFINFPVIDADYDEAKFGPCKVGPADPSIRTALDIYDASMVSPSVDLITKGLTLRMILHLFGDQAQPLHTVARCSGHPGHTATTKPQDGDLGGNLIYVLLNPSDVEGDFATGEPMNFHSFWDQGLGRLSPSTTGMNKKQILDQVAMDADNLMMLYPSEHFINMVYPCDGARCLNAAAHDDGSEILADVDAKPCNEMLILDPTKVRDWDHWHKMSVQFAKENVYTADLIAHKNCTVTDVTDNWGTRVAELCKLPENYDGARFAAVQQSLALAGYRLALYLDDALATLPELPEHYFF